MRNETMPFLFPKTMAQRSLEIYNNLASIDRSSLRQSNMPQKLRETEGNVAASLEAYDFFCQKYFGLGFVASFIPGTEAFLARKILSGEVDQFSNKLIRKLKTNRNSLEKRYHITLLRGVVAGAVLGEVLGVLIDILQPYRNKERQYDLKLSFKKLISYLPFLQDIYYVDSNRTAHLKADMLANLIHTLCNPVRLVDDFLSFLNKAINGIIEIGSEKYKESGAIRKGLKLFVGVVFTVINFPMKILKAIADIPYQILKNVIYDPLKFIASFLKKSDENLDQLIINNEDSDAIEELEKNAILKQINSKRQERAALPVAQVIDSSQEEAKTTGIIIESISEEDKLVSAIPNNMTPESFSQYGLPKPEHIETVQLSKDFRLFKLAPSSKNRVSQLIDIAHNKGLPSDRKTEAARKILVRPRSVI